MLTIWDELRHIELNCDEWRRMGRRWTKLRRFEAYRVKLWWMNANWTTVEMICVELVMSLKRVERIGDDFRVSETATGRLRDRLKHFHRVELNASRVWELRGMRNGKLGRNEKRERIWNRTRRNLRFKVASRLLNTWLITEGDAWGTSHGGLGGYQPTDAMACSSI